MSEPIRIPIEVELSPLAEFGTAAQRVAGNTKVMGDSFDAARASAIETASALLSMGVAAKDLEKELLAANVSAKNAAIAAKEFAGAAQEVEENTEKAAVAVSAMERAMAAGEVRIMSSMAGLGGLGSAFARVGAASSGLAPILAAAFPVVAAIAFVDVIEHVIEAYEKWVHLGEQTVHNLDDQTLSLRAQSDQLDVVNARLQNQINKLEHKPEDYMAVFLAEDKVRADQLAKSLEDVIQKTTTILKAGPGAFSEFVLGSGNESAVSKMLEPLERSLQLANLSGNKQAQLNVMLEAAGVLEKAITEEKGKQTRIVSTPFGPATAEAKPDIAAINAYQSALEGIRTKMVEIGKEETTSALEQQLADAKTAADKEAAAKKLQALIDKNKENAIRGAREEAEAVARGIKEWEELETKAQEAINKGLKENAEEEKRDARDAMAAWQLAAETRIKGEEEAFRVQQQSSENRMRDIKAQESLSTAGLNKGPVTNVIESAALQQQGAVAAAAMQEARDAAKQYGLELEIVKSVMAEVNQNTEAGAQQFKDLEKQMGQLQHLFDSANQATQRWGIALDQIKAKQAQLNTEMGFSWKNISNSIENASQAGFASFNSAFLRMMAGGMSFTRVMQSLWTGMVNSFITSILKMSEYYIERYIIMAAVKKIFGETDDTGAAANIAESEAERQAAIGAASAEAAVSQAIYGPAAAIAAAAITMGALEGITSAEQGGIVNINAHEGEMILPKHLSTFVQTAAASAGGIGGAGGPGGPGGAGGAAGHTFNFSPKVYGGASGEGMQQAQKDFTKMVTRELRRRGM